HRIELTRGPRKPRVWLPHLASSPYCGHKVTNPAPDGVVCRCGGQGPRTAAARRRSRSGRSGLLRNHYAYNLLRQRCFRRLRDELPNLLHGIIDLHVEEHLTECDARPASVAENTVVDPRRIGIGPRLASHRHRISESRRNQVLANPYLAAEI